MGKVDTKALKLAAVAATMLDGFDPGEWTELDPLGDGIRVLVEDGHRSLIASAHTIIDRAADLGSETEAARVYDAIYPHADFTWPHVRAITEVDPTLFDTDSPVTVTLVDPLPGAPVGDEPIADVARASSLAQALATIHSAAPEPVSDAGFAVEEPSRFQFLILDRLDQAASTGRVPATLLQHWEEEFEKVSLWHFLATPIHGSLSESSVYTDQERVLALSEIGRLRVSDPAIDLAAASALIDPAALPRFFSEYQKSRPRADEHIINRAELLAEFAVLDWLLEAVDSGDEEAIDDAAELLSSFNDVLFSPPPVPDSDDSPEPTVADDPGSAAGLGPAEDSGPVEDSESAEEIDPAEESDDSDASDSTEEIDGEDESDHSDDGANRDGGNAGPERAEN